MSAGVFEPLSSSRRLVLFRGQAVASIASNCGADRGLVGTIGRRETCSTRLARLERSTLSSGTLGG